MNHRVWTRFGLVFCLAGLLQSPPYAVAQADTTLPGAQASPAIYSVSNGSFESKLSGWQRISPTGTISVVGDGYYGSHSALFDNTGNETLSLSQTIKVQNQPGHPHVGDKVEAGAWVKLMPGAKQAPGTKLEIKIEGVLKNGQKVAIAQSTGLSDLHTGTWQYLLTAPSANVRVTNQMAKIMVSVSDAVPGNVEVDFVQAGQLNSLTGNPTKFVIGEYQPWYGSSPNWYHWAWNGGGTPHNPDTILGNGRRDLAAHYYPLVGAYDSTDKNLLRYQMDLMKAMGIDCILVDWYGDLVPAYRKTLDMMIELADKSDMKIAIFEEPKVHLDNWIPHKNRQEQLQAIASDITSYIDEYQNHKSILKVRGKPVVGVFGAFDTGLMNPDWDTIVKAVHHHGDNPYMIGDVVTGHDIPTSFNGMMNWVIFAQELQWDHSYGTVKGYSKMINDATAQWSETNPANNLGIGIVWPGFNDSGVDGWGAGPRVIPASKNFYSAIWDGMMQDKFNWVVIATFNDWNESTAIEPSLQYGYSRVDTTSQYIAKFKGHPAPELDTFPKIAREYDDVAPVTEAALSGKPGTDGSYKEPVELTLSSTDAKSGVANIYFSTNQGVTWNRYTRPVRISKSGTYTVEYYSVDNVGNKETVQRVNVVVSKG